MEGWIKLHRQVTENEFWHSERFTKAQAWIDLLLLATHKQRTVMIKGSEIRLKAGELCYSQKSLADRWRWNVKSVSIYLSMLSRREMLETKTDNKTTVITIRNWARYQFNGAQNGEQKDTRTETNKNVENEENVFTAKLISYLNEEKIVFDEGHLKARLSKALERFSQESVRYATNEAVDGWKSKGNQGNFVSYLMTILERNYKGI